MSCPGCDGCCDDVCLNSALGGGRPTEYHKGKTSSAKPCPRGTGERIKKDRTKLLVDTISPLLILVGPGLGHMYLLAVSSSSRLLDQPPQMKRFRLQLSAFIMRRLSHGRQQAPWACVLGA